MAGKYRACMQLEWTGTKEPLSDGADSRFHKAALWVFLSEKEWNKKAAKKYFSKMAGTKVNLPFDADKIIVDLSEAVC